MRTKHNWTPSDYDLTFPTDQIPSNINTQDTTDLTLQLQKKFPLSKQIHLNLDEKNKNIRNNVTCHTRLSLTVNDQIKEVKFL
jgi:hypothetical protein